MTFNEWIDDNMEFLHDSTILGDLRLAFNAGRKQKWHKVADGDLPPENTEVLTDDGVKVIQINGHWRYVYGDEWEDDACVDHWCEIPRFEE